MFFVVPAPAGFVFFRMVPRPIREPAAAICRLRSATSRSDALAACQRLDEALDHLTERIFERDVPRACCPSGEHHFTERLRIG